MFTQKAANLVFATVDNALDGELVSWPVMDCGLSNKLTRVHDYTTKLNSLAHALMRLK